MSRYVVIDPQRPDRAQLGTAARMLRQGGLVVFPTETVYGLGAAALDEDAVSRVYAVKGRPRSHPLIVHVARVAQARDLAAVWSPAAEKLAAAFWPGPLTLVVPKSDRVPDGVTGGAPSVALRIPKYPVALELLSAAGIPVVAPSANPYQGVSPTTAQHVVDGLGTVVDLIIDGGPTPIGIESTVVSLLDAVPRVLRAGMIGPEALRAVVPDLVYEPITDEVPDEPGGFRHSPGTAKRHYAPRARLELVTKVDAIAIDPGESVGWLLRAPEASERLLFGRVVITLPNTPDGYAAGLFAALHRFDGLGCTRILVERPPSDVAWDAVRDRLRRAATER